MNQLHFQRVWGGAAAHKELWRWHFGYPGTTVTCKTSQFYVCGENIKFYEVMVSNITKDISLLAWNSDIHPSKTFAWGLPKLTLSSFCSPELPDSWGIYSVLRVCPRTSRAVTAAVWWPDIFAIFSWRMCVPFPKDCTCPQGGVFVLDSDQH